MRPNTTTGQLPAASITYEPSSGFGGRITIDLAAARPAPRTHLLTAACELRSDAWPEDIEERIDRVAERHLQEATGTDTHIRLGGEGLYAFVHLPTPLTERPQKPAPIPTYGSPLPKEPDETYLQYRDPKALTSYQEAILPNVVETIRDVVPAALQPHVKDIAHLVTQEIPSQADLLRAYQRTSVPEVLNEVDHAGQPERLSLEHQRALKTAQLSFPHPAPEVLRSPTPAAAAATPTTLTGAAVSHAFDR
ncbi:hypothetical protein [Pseudarthrobacter defluvii]|uniref:hypothetical protein n=1 Tax=Pseudarthrobacter defluvii TaxID=410837 RepID=UPI00257822F7|nr:hypothetical protein [Pseudarthrobacter defluvii]WJH26862.1 hypothetical protein JCQ34_20885 [Pseudarthrobacter defluvii]